MLCDSTSLNSSLTGICFHAPMTDLWGPDEARVSRPVLREREGEVPSRHSPDCHVRFDGSGRGQLPPATLLYRSDLYSLAMRINEHLVRHGCHEPSGVSEGCVNPDVLASFRRWPLTGGCRRWTGVVC